MEYKRTQPNDKLPLYLGPSSAPYEFTVPEVVQERVGVSQEKRPTTIFQCIWFIHVGRHREGLLSWWKEQKTERKSVLAEKTEDLPQLADRASQKLSPSERRWRKKMRKKGEAITEAPNFVKGRGGRQPNEDSKKRRNSQSGRNEPKRRKK